MDVVARGLAAHLKGWPGPAGRLGFKVAFNSLAIQQRLGLPYSLVAGLTPATIHPADEPYSLSGLSRPALEAEVAVWLGDDRAVTHWAPAIELVDFNRELTELETILAEGVFHRAVIFGQPMPAPPGADLSGLPVTVRYRGAVLCEVDAGGATGRPADVLSHVDSLLAPHDCALQRGDVVILGAMNPLTFAEPDTHFEVTIAGLGEVSLALR